MKILHGILHLAASLVFAYLAITADDVAHQIGWFILLWLEGIDYKLEKILDKLPPTQREG